MPLNTAQASAAMLDAPRLAPAIFVKSRKWFLPIKRECSSGGFYPHFLLPPMSFTLGESPSLK